MDSSCGDAVRFSTLNGPSGLNKKRLLQRWRWIVTFTLNHFSVCVPYLWWPFGFEPCCSQTSWCPLFGQICWRESRMVVNWKYDSLPWCGWHWARLHEANWWSAGTGMRRHSSNEVRSTLCQWSWLSPVELQLVLEGSELRGRRTHIMHDDKPSSKSKDTISRPLSIDSSRGFYDYFWTRCHQITGETQRQTTEHIDTNRKPAIKPLCIDTGT